MSNELTTKDFQKPAGLKFTDVESGWKIAQYIAASAMVPKSLKGNPNETKANVFVAMQQGAEVGLTPMASIQNICVINGKPALYGDGMLAVVRNSGKLEKISETFEGEEGKKVDNSDWPDTFRAVCVVKRQGEEEREFTFSVLDAKRQGLWGKTGPWEKYKKRMLQMKARSLAMRDVFSDALLGLCHSVEELQSEMVDVTPRSNRQESQQEADDLAAELAGKKNDVIDVPANEETAENSGEIIEAVPVQEEEKTVPANENEPTEPDFFEDIAKGDE